MLNNIASFYETLEDADKATAAMQGHIRAFWDPRMRDAMSAFLQDNPTGQSAEDELKPFALKAFRYMEEKLLLY